MLDLQTVLALAAFSLVGALTPGPNNLMLMASGTNFGFRRTVPHILGINVGFFLMMVGVGSGVGALVQANATVGLVLKLVSGAYLLWFAWKIASAPVDLAAAQSRRTKPVTFLQAVAFQWVNPKSWVISMTAFAAYVPPDAGMIGVLMASLVIVMSGSPASLVWTTAGIQLRRLLDRPIALRMFNIGAAVLLIASLAITL